MSRSRTRTRLNEMRMSCPKRSTQPSSIVQSRFASVPSAWKSRHNLASIQPGHFFVSSIYGHTFASASPSGTVSAVPWRGLGSSATVRLSILYALNQLSGESLDRLTIFQLCADLEGHPDNAAPAAFGGFTVVAGSVRCLESRKLTTRRLRPTGGLLERGVPTFQRFEVSPRLYFVLLVPDLEIPTSTARKLLPSKISHAAAVANCANACAIAAAFASKDYKKLRGAFTDYLHQPFRGKLIPFLPGVIAGTEKEGALGAFLSGSGSTICAITLQQPDRVAAAMKRAARSSLSRTIVTRADNQGARIIRSPITDH